jgi:hypothetical protein
MLANPMNVRHDRGYILPDFVVSFLEPRIQGMVLGYGDVSGWQRAKVWPADSYVLVDEPIIGEVPLIITASSITTFPAIGPTG